MKNVTNILLVLGILLANITAVLLYADRQCEAFGYRSVSVSFSGLSCEEPVFESPSIQMEMPVHFPEG